MDAARPGAMTDAPTARIRAALSASLAILAKEPPSPQSANVAIDRTSHAGICAPLEVARVRPSRR